MAVLAGPAAAAPGSAPPAATAPACAGPVVKLQPLGAGRWGVLAHDGDADEGNRGQVSNLVLLRDGRRLWLPGSGPSPAFGRALACQVRQQLGLRVTDVVSPWARPELVLGVAGLGPVRHWAHAEVADAMAEQCPHCVDRLRQRLQGAADDLGPDPIGLPDHRLHGASGRLGPLRWWRLLRSAGRVVTVWRLPGPPLWLAPGLLGGDAPPDGRDADLSLLRQSAAQLRSLAAADGEAARFIGEQGPPQDARAPARLQAYWSTLLHQVGAAIERGDLDSAAPPSWPAMPPGWAGHPWHALNWQRGWRQVEPEVLAGGGAGGALSAPAPAAGAASLPGEPAAAVPVQRGGFQRSLR